MTANCAANDVDRLRELLLQIYVSGVLRPDVSLIEAEVDGILDTVLAAAEGRPFRPLPVPLPVRIDARPATADRASP
jgi:hypothetical protein